MNYQYSILIADDKKEIIKSVKNYLLEFAQKNRKAINIFEADTSIQALEIMNEHQIDIVFLDYHFENSINGDEVIQYIKDPFGGKFIVLMSGWQGSEVVNTIYRNHEIYNGRLKFLEKPISARQFETTFLEVLDFLEARSYPFPIQYAYKGAFNTGLNEFNRLWALMNFFEIFAKYSVYILMSDFVRHDQVKNLSVNINITQNLTFGAWIAWLDKLIDLGVNVQYLFMPNLVELLSENKKSYINLLYDIKNLRDSLAHGVIQEDQAYAEDTSKYASKATALYKEIAFFSRHYLFCQEKVTITNLSSVEYQYQVRSFMGSETHPDILELYTEKRLVDREIYLYSSPSSILAMSPFLEYQICPNCKQTRLFTLESIQTTQLGYKAFCNHGFKKEINKSMFEKYFIFSKGY